MYVTLLRVFMTFLPSWRVILPIDSWYFSSSLFGVWLKLVHIMVSVETRTNKSKIDCTVYSNFPPTEQRCILIRAD